MKLPSGAVVDPESRVDVVRWIMVQWARRVMWAWNRKWLCLGTGKERVIGFADGSIFLLHFLVQCLKMERLSKNCPRKATLVEKSRNIILSKGWADVSVRAMAGVCDFHKPQPPSMNFSRAL